jgi:hypothetical protein
VRGKVQQELSSPSNSELDFSRTLEIAVAVLKQDSANTYFLNFLQSLKDVPEKSGGENFMS